MDKVINSCLLKNALHVVSQVRIELEYKPPEDKLDLQERITADFADCGDEVEDRLEAVNELKVQNRFFRKNRKFVIIVPTWCTLEDVERFIDMNVTSIKKVCTQMSKKDDMIYVGSFDHIISGSFGFYAKYSNSDEYEENVTLKGLNVKLILGNEQEVCSKQTSIEDWIRMRLRNPAIVESYSAQHDLSSIQPNKILFELGVPDLSHTQSDEESKNMKAEDSEEEIGRAF